MFFSIEHEIFTLFADLKMGAIELLTLNFSNRLSSIPDKVRNRKTDMCIRRDYMENDTVIYKLPVDYKTIDLPNMIEINSQFGNYSAVSTTDGNTIKYIRHFELEKGNYPAEKYKEFREFLEQISTADRAVASLKN